MDIHIYVYIHGFLICGLGVKAHVEQFCQARELVFWLLSLARASIHAELGRKTGHLPATIDLNRSSKGQKNPRAHICIDLYIYIYIHIYMIHSKIKI